MEPGFKPRHSLETIMGDRGNEEGRPERENGNRKNRGNEL